MGDLSGHLASYQAFSKEEDNSRSGSLWVESKTFCVGLHPEPATPIPLSGSRENLKLMATEHKSARGWPGARTRSHPGNPVRGDSGQARTQRAHPTPPSAQWGFDLTRVSPPRAVVLGRRLQENTCRGRMRWARGRTHPRSGSAGTPVPRAHGAGVRRAAGMPDGGRGYGQLRHLPGNTSFPASGTNKAGNPWHHLPPTPRPRRRLPTAHPAQPTDTTAGVPVPAAAPNSGREGGVWAEKGRGQAPRLWVGDRGTEGHGLSEPRGRDDRRTLRQRRGFGRAADTAAAGFVIVDSVPSSAEHAGNGRGSGGRGAPVGPGGSQRQRAGPEVNRLLGRGRLRIPSLPAGVRLWLSSPDPGKILLGRPVSVLVAVRARTTASLSGKSGTSRRSEVLVERPRGSPQSRPRSVRG
ncbi:translation initiation factor IF-2-like [Rhinolophus ferrumequinum]|uniref:translation initiation factor IF-2-like n=1 Tax=Rhinolophus ferrumequinum TaxID=59479 RepID=UPI00140F5C1C|nr:translation initiation factor IF-2-like [Rhinolophus ferrumequinum]